MNERIADGMSKINFDDIAEACDGKSSACIKCGGSLMRHSEWYLMCVSCSEYYYGGYKAGQKMRFILGGTHD